MSFSTYSSLQIFIFVIIIIIIVIAVFFITVFAGVLFVHQPSANHAPGASWSVTHSHSQSFCSYTKHLTIRADPSMEIFWISVTVVLSDTFLMSSTIPFFTVPSAPTTTGITTVSLCHIFCISSSRSLYLLFLSISFSAMFLSDWTVHSISLQVEFTESLTMMPGLFAVIVLSVLTGMSHMMVMLLSLLCITVSGSCSYHLSVISISWSLQMLQWRYAAALLCLWDVLCFG